MIGDVCRLRCTVIAALALLTGCASAVVRQDTDRYYSRGAEQVLTALESNPVRPADRLLALMDEAVAEQELGRYEDSNRALAAAIEMAGATPGPGPGRAADDDGVYRGETFERVYLRTLRMANDLALQDTVAAAEDAGDALAAISEGGCTRCRYPFTRYLAAVSLEAAGDVDRAVDVLAEALVESPDLPFLEAELDRLLAADEARRSAREPAGERVLYAFFLLGKGPRKVPEVLPVPPNRVVPWPQYEPRWPPGVTGATLLVDRQDHVAATLTDMEELARDSLAERLEANVRSQVGQADAAVALQWAAVGNHHSLNLGMMLSLLPALRRCDLRHWSTLPATCQVVRVVVEPGTSGFELIYTAADGVIVDREKLELPGSWTDGPLFVTRRLP